MGAVASTPSVSLPVRRPVPQPYVRLATMLEDGVFVYAPALARRLCLPADYTNNKLFDWNQKTSSTYSNTWVLHTSVTLLRGHLAQVLINSGTSVFLHFISYQWPTIHQMMYHTVFDWSHDKALNKFSFEFYLDNDLEETDPTVIYDDDETFWTARKSGSGSYDVAVSEETTEKVKGTSSLKIVVSSEGEYENLGATHSYGEGTEADYSSKEFLGLYIYGANTGLGIRVQLVTDGTNYAYWSLTDNFTGWKRFVIPLKNPDTVIGTLGLSSIRNIDIFYLVVDQTFTSYLDRTVIDVGQWVKVEVYVPDALAPSGDQVKLFSYDPSAEDYHGTAFAIIGDSDSIDPTYLEFLDETLGDDITVTAADIISIYAMGERDDVRSAELGNASDITYSSYYGCLKRIGFAIKMPPDDGQDSSTAGISQCKLKLEVYYDKVWSRFLNRDIDGPATYEFENSSNNYYGLQEWNERWLALFDETTKTVEFLFFSERPTSFKVRADEDELIDMIEVGLPAGARVWLGELTHGDLTRDTDSDDVPDFIEDFIQNLIPKRSW